MEISNIGGGGGARCEGKGWEYEGGGCGGSGVQTYVEEGGGGWEGWWRSFQIPWPNAKLTVLPEGTGEACDGGDWGGS